MYTFVPHKSFVELLDISPENFIFLEIFDSEFSYIKVYFGEQNSNLLEIENKVNITLVINYKITFENDTLFSSPNRSRLKEEN